MNLHDFDRARQVSDLNQLRSSTEKLDRTADWLDVLGKIAKLLVSSYLDLRSAFECSLPLIIPRIAEWCMIIVQTQTGEYSCLAARHIDLDKNATLQKVVALSPQKVTSDLGGPGFAAKYRKVELLSEMDSLQSEDFLQRVAPPGIAPYLREIGLRSHLTVPMISGEQVLGVMTFAMSSADRKFREEDIQLATQLAILSAELIKSSRLYVNAKTLAEKLQVERELRLKYMRRQIHDIKTPLSAALLSLELVKRFQGNHEKEATLIERATKNVLRAVEMLTSLISEEEKLISSFAS